MYSQQQKQNMHQHIALYLLYTIYPEVYTHYSCRSPQIKWDVSNKEAEVVQQEPVAVLPPVDEDINNTAVLGRPDPPDIASKHVW